LGSARRARALGRRRWARLERAVLANAGVGAAGLAALARGDWPALERLALDAGLDPLAPLELEAARLWAPPLEVLKEYEEWEFEGEPRLPE
jgi:hypothetical protein